MVEENFLVQKEQGYHGIGLVNVQAVVDKYKGIMEISNTGDFFKIDIVLYVGSQHRVKLM